MAVKAGVRAGRPGAADARGGPGAAIAAAAVAAVLLAAVGGLSLAFFATHPGARQALAGYPDHPWWLVYRDPVVADGSAWAIGAAAAASLFSAVALLASRRLPGRCPILPVFSAGLFLLTFSFESLRGAAGFLIATERSIGVAVFLTRAVYWSRFSGMLALLVVALHAMDLREQRPAVLLPIVLVAALAMAASVPVDRTIFLAQLTFRLGDERGVWFVNLVIGVITPLGVIAAAVVRRQPRLVVLAGSLALLLAARELLFFGLRPERLAVGLACLVAGSMMLLEMIRSGCYPAARDARGSSAGMESSAR
jgi:hypothetical protein